MEEMQHEKGREPTMEELSAVLSMEPEEIMLSMEAVVEIESMEQNIYAKDGKEISLKDRLTTEKNEQEVRLRPKAQTCPQNGGTFARKYKQYEK